MTPDRWLVLMVRVPSVELTSELTGGLLALGGTAVEEGGEWLTTYVPAPDEPESFLEAAHRALAGITPDPELEWRWQDDEDWAAHWKDGLAPRPVGARMIVTQPWNPVEATEDRDIVILVDPSAAFGTGEHATTRGALRLLEVTVEGGDHVLDLGAGSGILSIAAVRLGAGTVLALEADGDAVAVARENLDRNGVGERVRLIQVRVDEAYLTGLASTCDVVVANILSGILVPLLPALADTVRPRGAVILGGILDTEVDALEAAAVAAGLSLDVEDREEEWWTGRFHRTAAPRR